MAPKRIVAVDDHPDNLDSLCALLRLWGYEVDGAEDGQRALSLAFTRHADIVIMDLALPDGDALDVIRRIKAADDDIIVVAFSGWHHLESTALAAGADAFVLKPDVDALERLLACRRGSAAERRPKSAKKTG